MVIINIIRHIYLNDDMWELVSFIHGQTRKICLELLSSGPKTPTTIVKTSGKHLSHISRALRELEKKGLVECLTPDLPKNRIYRITSKGKEILEKMKELQQS